MIKYLSSDIDWCEDNFTYCDYIAEFWNSLTSLLFVMYGLFGLYKTPIKTYFTNILYFNNIFIGVTSVLFHSTLSIEGQILDEFSILFYIFIGLIYVQKYYIKYPFLTYISVPLLPLVVYMYPIMNRFLLFSISAYVFKVCKDKRKELNEIDNELFNIYDY